MYNYKMIINSSTKGCGSKNVSHLKCGWFLIFCQLMLTVNFNSPVHSDSDFIPRCKISWDIWERVKWRNYLALTSMINSIKLEFPHGLLFCHNFGQKIESKSIWHESRVHDDHFKQKFMSLAPRVLILWPLQNYDTKNWKWIKLLAGKNHDHRKFTYNLPWVIKSGPCRLGT